MRPASSPKQNDSCFSRHNRHFQRGDKTLSNVFSVIPGCIPRLPSCDEQPCCAAECGRTTLFFLCSPADLFGPETTGSQLEPIY